MCHLGIEGLHVFSFTGARDNRGTWQRIFDRSSTCVPSEIRPFEQISVSFNLAKGTLRGMHYLDRSAGEWKLVSVARGSVLDFVIDLREDSESYGEALKLSLSESGTQSVLIPPGVAHGFITLEPETTLVYSMTAQYNPALDMGVNWQSPALRGLMVDKPSVISSRDSNLPMFEKARKLS
jgi:dTDP-4-dehydrorhamnose 3,5-epimerase